MIHPLIDDLSDLSDTELQEKIADLSKKYWLNNNPSVQSQILLVLEQHKEEQRVRIQQSQQQNQDSDENDLDNLINIS